ncbi:hypothetical protein F4604DRAFT_1864865 [Suillus subluteus]|nr:hypothetical protein F4604DRAFT_1864865 [Suillus subluteus]
MTVGTMNRTNKAYIGHFHILLKNCISRLLDLTADAILSDNANRTGWVNGNDYEQTCETFRMIQFSPAFFKPLGMMEFNGTFAREQRLRRQFVAESQGTLMAVLPIHTREERDLFQLLVTSSPLFADPARQPNWVSLAVIWAGHADGRKIFYKLPEHLKVYYKTWTDFCNEHNTVALNVEASQRIRALFHDSLTICPSVDITEVSSWQIGKILADHTLQQSAVHYLYADAVQARATVAGPSRAAKRKTTGDNITTGEAAVSAKRRTNKPRKCRNCQSSECPG